MGSHACRCYLFFCTINLEGIFGSSGAKDILYKRLKSHLRVECISKDPTAPWELQNQCQTNPYNLDYLCILDFEATCEDPNPPDYIHEIIEFPVVLLNLKTLQIVSELLVS